MRALLIKTNISPPKYIKWTQEKEIEDQENLEDFGDLDVSGPVGGQASTAAGSVDGAGEVGPVS